MTSKADLAELAAELVSLSMFAGRAPTEHGREQFHKQADEFTRRANTAGYPSIADAINAAKKRETWAGRAEALRDAAAALRDAATRRPVGESIAADVRETLCLDTVVRTAWSDLDPDELRRLAHKHTSTAAYGFALANFRERSELDGIVVSALSPSEAAALADEKRRRDPDPRPGDPETWDDCLIADGPA